MSSYADRLKALREQLKASQLDGFVVPLTDEHMSEYVGSYAQRLAWLTGFQGSDRKSTRLNSSHMSISYAVFCLKKKKKIAITDTQPRNYPMYATQTRLS